MIKLSQLKIGSSAVVAHLDGTNRLVSRMMELGFVPGALVEVIRKAPLGDPVQYRIRGTRISIRRAEADSVQVIPNDQSGTKTEDSMRPMAVA
jgi:Fe2+ transport system protein FeoA